MLSLFALAISLPVMTSTAVSTNKPLQVELSPEYRWALINALQRRLDGKFIITGLADADLTCHALRSCTTSDELISPLRDASTPTNISSLDDLLSRTTISGAHPTAIVSLRTSHQLSRSAVQVVASVYDTKTRQWTQNIGVIKYIQVTAGVHPLIRPKLVSWTMQSE